jgi:hypothetical protein
VHAAAAAVAAAAAHHCPCTRQIPHQMHRRPRAGLANCSNWKAGVNSTCPATCKLSQSPSGPATLNLQGCAACTDGERNNPLTCFRCRPRFAHIYYAIDLHVITVGGAECTACV